MFSEPESFLISVFGLTVIGSLAGNSILKGLLMGLVGLFLATVGMDSVTGTLRYTFGFDSLMNGIQMVPALIGLFTISQVMSNCEDYKHANQSILEKSNATLGKKMLPTLKEIPRYIWNWVSASIIGIVVGILPGAGGNIGSWIAYDQAKKHSKHKEEFGNGSLEGLASCEAGNNAVTGGSMIPLMTLSIPGSPNAAIILGGLLIQGLSSRRAPVHDAGSDYLFDSGRLCPFQYPDGIRGTCNRPLCSKCNENSKFYSDAGSSVPGPDWILCDQRVHV